MKKFYYYLGLAVFVLGGSLYFHSNFGESNSLKHFSPETSIKFLREKLLVYRNQELLQERLKRRNELVKAQRARLKVQEEILINFSAGLDTIDFYRNEDPQNLRIDGQDYLLTKFRTLSLPFGKNPKATGSSYLDYSDGNLILASAAGMFGYVDVAELSKDRFQMTVIPTNIKEIITYDEFYGSGQYGIKDLLIYDENVYVSFSNQVTKDCFNTSILASKLSLEKLTFKEFFTPSVCVAKKNAYGEFHPIQSGGRMVPYEDDQILFSIGDYRFRDHAQDESNVWENCCDKYSIEGTQNCFNGTPERTRNSLSAQGRHNYFDRTRSGWRR
jgi:hypothetical protein